MHETAFDNFGTVAAGSSAVAGGAILFEQVSLSPSLSATLTNEASGILEAANGGELAIDALGQTISNAGLIAAQDGGTVWLLDLVVNNTNTIEVNSAGTDPPVVTQLLIGTVTLQGGNGTSTGPGQLLLSDAAENIISSDGSDAAVLTNVDNTISGSGTIGDVTDPLFTLINDPLGVIDAGTNAINPTAANALVIANDSPMTGDTLPSNAVVNEGLIEATGPGGLAIDDSTINNAGVDTHGNILDGQIQVGAHSEITLDNATILHGFFTVLANGEVATVSGSANVINTSNGPTHNTSTVTISNAGTMVVNDNSSLTLVSPYNIQNSGAIELFSTTDKTFLYFNQPDPILSGKGDIILEGGAGSQDIIAGLPGLGFTTVALENEDNTFSGAGTIGQGDGELTLQNNSAGIFNANLDHQTLTLDTGVTEINSGLMEATSGGILQIDDDLTNNESLKASGGGELQLDDSMTATGGTLMIDSASLLAITAGTGTGATLDDVSVTVSNAIEGIDVESGAILKLDGGTPINSADGGTLTIGGTGTLDVETLGGSSLSKPDATLDGIIVTDDNAGGGTYTGIEIADTTSGAILKLDGGTQINSADGGTLTIGSTGTLDVETLGGSTVSKPDATLDGIIVTDDNAGGGTYDGIEIADATSGAILTLDGGTTISGGTLAVESGGVLAITDGTGATLDNVVVDDDGTGAGTQAGIYVASGVLTLGGNTQIQGGGPVSGTLTIASAGELQIVAGGATLDGVNVTDSNPGTTDAGIDVSGAILTLNDSTVISGGTLTVESTTGSELQIAAGSGADGATPGSDTLTGLTVTDSNATEGIYVASGAILTLDGGTQIQGGGTGTFSNAGTVLVTGGIDLIKGVTVTDLGTNSQLTVSGGTLTLDHDTFSPAASGDILTITVDSGAVLNIDNSSLLDVILNEIPGSTVNVSDSTVQTVKSTLSGLTTVVSGQTLTLVDETVYGTVNNYGTIDVETAGVPPNGALFDGVSVLNFATTDGIEVGTNSAATLELDDGASVSGGYITISSIGALVVQEGISGPNYGATLDGVIVTDATPAPTQRRH